MKNWLNCVEFNIAEIQVGEEKVVIRELVAARFLPLARLLLTGNVTEFLFQCGLLQLPVIERLLNSGEAEQRAFIEAFYRVHLGESKEGVGEKELDFFEESMKIILGFSKEWGIHPFKLMEIYSIRQLTEMGSLLYPAKESKESNSEPPPGAKGYKRTVDEFGAVQEEWEEEV